MSVSQFPEAWAVQCLTFPKASWRDPHGASPKTYVSEMKLGVMGTTWLRSRRQCRQEPRGSSSETPRFLRCREDQSHLPFSDFALRRSRQHVHLTAL